MINPKSQQKTQKINKKATKKPELAQINSQKHSKTHPRVSTHYIVHFPQPRRSLKQTPKFLIIIKVNKTNLQKSQSKRQAHQLQPTNQNQLKNFDQGAKNSKKHEQVTQEKEGRKEEGRQEEGEEGQGRTLRGQKEGRKL